MSGYRVCSDLDIIPYGEKNGQRRKNSIKTDHAKKSGRGGDIKTIHIKDARRSGRAMGSKMTRTPVKSRNAKAQRPYDVRESRQAFKRRKRRQRVFIARFICALSICIVAGCAGMSIYGLLFEKEQLGEIKIADLSAFTETVFQKEENWTIEDILAALEQEGIPCSQDFLTVNEYSRPGDKLKKVNNIFVHYTANPATSAAQNRSYFENLAQTHETSASAHFIIGYEGELVQCIPLEEIAYAVAGRNEDSISIECCYLDEDGKFTNATYDTLVHFTARLLQKYGLEAEDLRRHYDEGGKACPKYYVENEDEWWKFIKDVKVYKNTLQEE